ncbi:MAG TPA: ABC transporter permease [Actinomycetota bacterium]|nr:ABC transporter permease [Actinomycetota bacterium]
MVGALLLSLVSAAYPLFLSRSEGELLDAEIANPTITPYGAGMFYGVTNVRFEEKVDRSNDVLLADRLDQEFTRLAAEGPHLARPVRYALGAAVNVTLPGGIQAESGPVSGWLFSGTDAARNVDVVSGSEDGGAMIPDLIADEFDVGPGDMIEITGDRRTVDLQVGGVYRSLYSQPRRDYWLPWGEQIFPQCADCSAPPQFILVRRQQLVDLTRKVGERDVDLGWVAPVTGLPLTLDEAREVNAYTGALTREMTDRQTTVGQLFRCCGQSYGGSFFFGRRDTEFRSAMPLVMREVERRAATVEGPLRLLLIAGLGVAAAVVAAAAAFAVAGRRTEAALLHARGWGPLRFATKSTLEAAIPVALGAAAGLGLGWLLISLFAPPAPAASSARAASVTGAAAAAAAALVVLGVVSGVSFLRTFEVHALGRRFAWVPWELFAIAAALWVLSRLHAGGALIEDTRLDIRRPSALLLVFPVLFVAGFATLGARIAVEALRRTGSRLGRGSPVSYLAVHRLTGLPRLTVLLVSAAALCLGVFVNAQTMVRSLRATVDAKAGVFVGSDVQVWVDHNSPVQAGSFPLPMTRATRLKYAGSLLPGERRFDMVGIDPSTFVGAAFWDDAFADEPLEEMVSRLGRRDGPLPVLLVQGQGTPQAIEISGVVTPIEVVGRPNAFPGVYSDDPLLVVDAAALEQRLGARDDPLRRPGARTELWIAGDPDEALAALSKLDAFPLATTTAVAVKDVPFIKAAIETFSMLNVLGFAAALLVIGVLVVYLQARQRARTISNVLSMRMGMRPRQARAALVLELAAMLLTAFVLGAALGMIAARLVSPLLDPLQTIPPAPLFDAPLAVVGWTLMGLAVVAVAGGWLVHRRAAAVDLGEVLRVAE